jgi:hypothetical protein
MARGNFFGRNYLFLNLAEVQLGKLADAIDKEKMTGAAALI